MGHPCTLAQASAAYLATGLLRARFVSSGISRELGSPEEILQFLSDWEAGVKPRVDGLPILRIAVLDPDRVPVTHQTVEGVPDEVLVEYHETAMYEELELSDLVAQHGGSLHTTLSSATSLAMTRAPEGGYRVYELDSACGCTGFDTRYETLDEALRMSALGYGHPPGTLTWKEVPANR